MGHPPHCGDSWREMTRLGERPVLSGISADFPGENEAPVGVGLLFAFRVYFPVVFSRARTLGLEYLLQAWVGGKRSLLWLISLSLLLPELDERHTIQMIELCVGNSYLGRHETRPTSSVESG